MTDNTSTLDPNINAANTPATPMVDTTSEYDTVSSYLPKLAKGTITPLVQLLDFNPFIKKDDGSFMGWEVTLALVEDASNEFGEVMPAGTRLGRFTLFTTESQYSSAAMVARQAKLNIMGLAGIVIDPKGDPRNEKAETAFALLPPHMKLPGRLDTDTTHYRYWVDAQTIVRAVLTTKEKESELQTNCNGLLAKDTAARTPRA